jgi:hypothetical protein
MRFDSFLSISLFDLRTKIELKKPLNIMEFIVKRVFEVMVVTEMH